jgi:hypothetical protein
VEIIYRASIKGVESIKVFLPTRAVLVQWYLTVLVVDMGWEDLAAHNSFNVLVVVHGPQIRVPYLCKGYMVA